jgi:hypothetical protein
MSTTTTAILATLAASRTREKATESERLRATLEREREKEEERLRAAWRPERLDFIDRITRLITESGASFEWRFRKLKRVCNESRSTHRWDEVYLEIACVSSDCGKTGHLITLRCFPMSERPDAEMLCSPYQTSVEFWSRVFVCTFDGAEVFWGAKNIVEIGGELHHHITSQPQICRAFEFIFTCVLDHVPTVSDPYTREQLLPRCFNLIPSSFPHAFVAHAHRWGTSTQNPLSLIFDSAQFWRTCVVLRARMLLPVACDTVRYITAGVSGNVNDYEPEIRDLCAFHAYLPNVMYAATIKPTAAVVMAIATAFPRVQELDLFHNDAISYRRSARWHIMKRVLDMHCLERLFIAPLPATRSRDLEGNMLARDVSAFVKSRRGLLELAAADYLATRRPAPTGDAAAPKAWSAYFGSSSYERQTFGIIARFLYGARFIQTTKLLIDFCSGGGDDMQ